MWSKVSILSLAAVALLAACKDDDQPDARSPQPNFPDAKVADAPLSMIDARLADAAGSTADAPVASADAPAPVDAGAPQADAKIIANPATVILNEVSPNIAMDHELIELLVTKAGSTENIAVYQDYVGVGTSLPRLLAVLPAADVAVDDLIVVHTQPTDDIVDETSSSADCQGAGCYAAAWDARGETPTTANIGYSYRTITVKAANGDVLDVVPFMRQQSFAPNNPLAFQADLPLIISEGKWLTTCAAPCDYTNLPNMYAASVNWGGAGNSPTGLTIQRKAGGVREKKVTDWSTTTVEQTLGAANTTN